MDCKSVLVLGSVLSMTINCSPNYSIEENRAMQVKKDYRPEWSDDMDKAQELPFWKVCLWFMWGFTVGFFIGG